MQSKKRFFNKQNFKTATIVAISLFSIIVTVFFDQILPNAFAQTGTGTITGDVFNDINGNLIKDASDKPVPNWIVKLTKDGNTITTLTVADSTYSFPNLEQGTYQISADMPVPYVPTQPLNNTYQVTISSGSSIVSNFGIFKNSPELLDAFGDIVGISPEGQTIDSQGFLYTVDTIGNAVIKFDINGNLVMKFGSTGTDPGQFLRPSGIAVDSQGNIFVSDINNRVQKFDPNGNFLLQWGNPNIGPSNAIGQFNGARGLAVDGQDNIYVADGNNHRLQKFDNNGNYIMTISKPGVPYSYVRLPFDVAIDSQGNIFVADTGNNRIQKFDSNGNFLTSLVQFNRPRAIAIAPNDYLYVADTYNNRIQVFDNNNNFVMAFGTLGADPGEFGNPSGLAIDNAGILYVVDSSNDRIQSFNSNDGLYLAQFRTRDSPIEPYFLTFDASGHLITSDGHNHKVLTFDPNTDVLLSEFGELGSNAGEFRGPRGIAIDATGNMYVADNYNDRVQKFDSNGNFLLQWGSTGTAPGQFIQPRGVVIDSDANILVADTQNNRVQKFDQNGNFLSSFNSFLPYQIALDVQGNIYAAEEFAHHVEKYDSAGNSLLVIGSSGSGPGQLSNPRGVSLDSSGNIYVADSANNRIQKFDPNGNFLTLLGTGGSGIGQFRNPRGILIDSAGNLWVDDTGNLRIQELDSNLNFIKQITYSSSGIDTTPPVVTAPADTTQEAIGSVGNVVIYSGGSAIDLIDGIIIPTCTPSSGSTFPLGDTIVTCIATDSAGNVGSDSFTVTIQDTTPPILTVPAAILVEATDTTGATVSYTASSFDLVDGSPSPTPSTWSSSVFFALKEPDTDTVGMLLGYYDSSDYIPAIMNEPQFSLFADQIKIIVSPSHSEIQNQIDLADDFTYPPDIINYDIENWQFTPPEEKVDPALSILQAADIVHSAGYQFGTSPGRDILLDIYQTFDWTRVDFLVLQFQSSVVNPNDYKDVVNQVSTVVKASNPSIKILAQVDMQNTPDQIITALSTIRDSPVDGVSILWYDTVPDSDLEQVVEYIKLGTTGSGAINCTPASGSTFPLGDTIVTCMATDSAGNSATSTFTIKVQEIFINTISTLTPKWNVDAVTISGTTIGFNSADNIAVDWGDGSSTTNIPISSGSWGPVSHTYGSSAISTNPNQIIAKMIDGTSGEVRTTSSPSGITVQKHLTTLTLVASPTSVARGGTYSLSGTLIDSTTNTPMSSKTILFGATSPITISSKVTSSSGTYTVSGLTAPNTAGTYQIQALYSGDSLYNIKFSVKRTLTVS